VASHDSIVLVAKIHAYYYFARIPKCNKKHPHFYMWVH